MARAALRRAGQAMAPLLAGRSASLFEATRVFASHPLPSSSSTQDCISFNSTKFLQDALSEFKLSPFSSQHLNLQGSAQMERLSEEEAIAMLTPMGAPSSSFLEEALCPGLEEATSVLTSPAPSSASAVMVIWQGSRQLEVAEYLLVGLQRGGGNFRFDDIALPPSLCFPGFPSLTINTTVALLLIHFHRCAKAISGENLQVMFTCKLLPSHIGLPLLLWSMNLERCLSAIGTNLVMCHGPGS